MNEISYFEIQATNPKELIVFYENVFGWKFTKEEKLPIEYYRIKTEGMNGGLLKRPAKTPPGEYGTNAFTCSAMVSNFDKTAERILKNGGQVALPKFAVPGKCWQGYFIDTDHNTFGIFEVDENAK
ncbi:MAG TPA: VOC family protein [Candidatus Paceibacterota bacterium]|jgi:predicted enzyme related to lactoylglutathione lyase|nr:VOC family protein [Candidatus Paceibacterota bacterium]